MSSDVQVARTTEEVRRCLDANELGGYFGVLSDRFALWDTKRKVVQTILPHFCYLKYEIILCFTHAFGPLKFGAILMARHSLLG